MALSINEEWQPQSICLVILSSIEFILKAGHVKINENFQLELCTTNIKFDVQDISENLLGSGLNTNEILLATSSLENNSTAILYLLYKKSWCVFVENCFSFQSLQQILQNQNQLFLQQWKQETCKLQTWKSWKKNKILWLVAVIHVSLLIPFRLER